MYQILLLDDEQLALQSVQVLVPWNQLDVSRVLTADDVDYAKELLDKFKIDLVICDIEMPKTNGIEFAEWLRTAWPSVEILMLTGHRNFNYVQQALRAGCLDYILKPVTSEALFQSVQKALKHIEQKRTLENNSTQWKDLANVHREKFIRDILQRTLAKSSDIDKAAVRLGIVERCTTICRPIYIEIRRWSEEYSSKDKALLKFGVCNIAQELIVGSDRDGVTLQFGADRIFVILEDLAKGSGVLQRACLQLIEICNTNLNCDISCYVGKPVPLVKLADEVDAVLLYPMELVVPYNEVHFSESRQSTAQPYSWEADIHRWFQMLQEGQFQKVLEDVRGILTSQEKKNLLGVLELKQLQQDFKQQLYLSLEKTICRRTSCIRTRDL